MALGSSMYMYAPTQNDTTKLANSAAQTFQDRKRTLEVENGVQPSQVCLSLQSQVSVNWVALRV